MPRPLQVLLTLTLFTATMTAIGWVLRQVMPSVSHWLGQTFGNAGANGLVVVLIVGFALFGYWPRTPEGAFRRLSRRG